MIALALRFYTNRLILHLGFFFVRHGALHRSAHRSFGNGPGLLVLGRRGSDASSRCSLDFRLPQGFVRTAAGFGFVVRVSILASAHAVQKVSPLHETKLNTGYSAQV